MRPFLFLIMAVDGYPTLNDLSPEALRRVT